MIGFFSSGIGCLRHLDQLLEGRCKRLFLGKFDQDITAVAGWGLRPTTVKARRYAIKNGLPYLSLEDGFIRSLGLGVDNSPLHSLIVDQTGIYYDATRVSDLETLIHRADFSIEELIRAQKGIELLRCFRLSKYNHAPDHPITGLSKDKCKVLVVDQTCGDASIKYGLADAERFTVMLQTACADNPDAEIVVKVHPDVLAGKKRGHLVNMAYNLGCTVISYDISPWSLLDVVDKVYVVTSQLGFEALLAGKEVFCFGAPFYAGWGLTSDHLSVPRRGVSRTLEQLFAAAYLRYCRYINPYTGKRCEFEQTVALLADQKRQRDRSSGKWLGVGFGYWKKSFVPQFLGKKAKVSFQKKFRLTSNSDYDHILVWASDQNSVNAINALPNTPPVSFMEDGFIRSVGLGADAINPLSLVIDSTGIYYDSTRPSGLESTLQHFQFSDSLLQRAAKLRFELIQRRLSKYNVGSYRTIILPKDKIIILVPGQVETDASIRMGTVDLKTNAELLSEVRLANPDAFIIYKPHPDVLAGARLNQSNPENNTDHYDLMVSDIPMPELLEQVDEVHTLTSLTGFEALLREKTVVTYGLPFYAGWGLTRDRHSCPRRTRVLTVDQLVAASLILYPGYVDPLTGDLINAETAVEIICEQRQKPAGFSLNSWVWKRIRKAE